MVFKKKQRFSLLSLFRIFIDEHLILLAASCTRNHIQMAESLIRNKHYEEVQEHYLRTLKSNPDSIDLKIDIDRLLKQTSQYYHTLSLEQKKMGKNEMAVFLYKKSLEYDPANSNSRRKLALLLHRGKEIQTIEKIKREMAINIGMPRVLMEKQPVDMIFKNKVSLKKMFQLLIRTGQINILFDSGFRDRKITVSLVKTLSFMFELTYVTDLEGTYMPPTLRKRRVSTTLLLKDNEIGIIAGLTRGSNTEGTDGIPILSSIPFIKEVFSS